MMKLLAIFAAILLTGPAVAAPVTAADQRAVIAGAARLLEQRYVDAKAGAKLARNLEKAAPQWRSTTDAEAFAKAVTDWLRKTSGDGHLGLSYSAATIPEGEEESFSEAEMLRFYGPQVNHGVERVERLAGNIMLLDLRVFPPPGMGGDVFSAAMTLVAQGDALIIDLRKNGGGLETANLLTGYLLDEAKPLSGSYDRPSDKATANTSPVWVPGRRFGGAKPLFILTSRRTFSAAEAVAYDLQALGRAVVVGERTGGGAHPFAYRRVHPHFALDLPEGRSINLITGTNWQGVGVKPNVEVPADTALDTALDLARKAIAAK